MLGYLARDSRELPTDFQPEWMRGFRSVFDRDYDIPRDLENTPQAEIYKHGQIAAELLIRCYPCHDGDHNCY